MSLATLAEIGLKALHWQEAIEQRRAARIKLRNAYSTFRSKRNLGGYITKGTDLYDMMMEETDIDFTKLQEAKRAERSAARKLESACVRASKELDADAQAATAIRKVMEKSHE